MNVLERMEKIGAKKKMADFQVKQAQDYNFKKKYAAIRVREFIQQCDLNGYNYHVSVGGLDSITLWLFIRSLGYDPIGISASYLEDRSIIKVHCALGIECVKPITYNDENGNKFGWAKVLDYIGVEYL